MDFICIPRRQGTHHVGRGELAFPFAPIVLCWIFASCVALRASASAASLTAARSCHDGCWLLSAGLWPLGHRQWAIQRLFACAIRECNADLCFLPVTMDLFPSTSTSFRHLVSLCRPFGDTITVRSSIQPPRATSLQLFHHEAPEDKAR